MSSYVEITKYNIAKKEEEKKCSKLMAGLHNN